MRATLAIASHGDKGKTAKFGDHDSSRNGKPAFGPPSHPGRFLSGITAWNRQSYPTHLPFLDKLKPAAQARPNRK